MNRTLQWLIIGGLIVVGTLQAAVLVKLNSIQPKTNGNNQAQASIPSLQEIDGRIMHWGQHFGAAFSSGGRIACIESSMNSRLDSIEKKLDELKNTK